jgi:glycosyltransferase involved in cell wall biosynthesis
MEQPTPPRVSVIIPCYNLGEFLDEAVESVLTQTYQDFEIVIVDDGSTDARTLALLAEYQRPKTRVIRMEHRGLAVARNTGIAAAAGAYVCALDADDRLEPLYFEKSVPLLDTDPTLGFVSCWLRTFGDERWDWKPDTCDLPTLLWENTVLTAALVRRDAVLAIGGYNTEMPAQGDEDWDLWLTLAEHGHRGAILSDVLFNYRRRGGSLSARSWYGSDHLTLARYRLEKHKDAYRSHFLDVFRHQDDETSALLRLNDETEQYLATELEPAVALRRKELVQLRARLALSVADEDDRQSAKDLIRDLEIGLAATATDAAALRNSMSWRVTAPLRAIYGQWLRWRGLP